MIPPPHRPERRQAPRVEERVPVALSGADGEVRAETTNLSAAGAYCTLERFIPPMTKLAIKLELPDGQRRRRIRCAGVVVRVEPVLTSAERGRYHMAILFTELSERDRSAISALVRRRLSNTTPSTD